MILTTRGRYAIMAVLDMVQGGGCAPVSLSSISKRQGISLSYLEQIFLRLRKSGIVSSVKGSNGGYVLVALKSKITAADVIKAVQEPIKMTRCNKDNKGCMGNDAKCKTHNLWQGLETVIYSYLQSVAIADIGNRHRNL